MMSLYQNHQESIATKKFSKFFPGKLRNMLDSVQGLGLAHGISWVSPASKPEPEEGAFGSTRISSGPSRS
ncbi:hypothetical protein QTG54_002089 [Skeletonema marinoi]|uniref:Uncharacterized protein n=1 Tax=Skeletonema marinoi TaxID=267567 RepID=A0AAD9DI88_9STRA|nr:hypothetical protein QTG54_002089 [Skeletonema marinoi]